MVMLAAFPDRYASSTFTGVKVWAVSVLPSLLPFFFLTSLLSLVGGITQCVKFLSPFTGLLYRTSGIAAYVQLMSFLSGYPVGVKIIADLKKGGVITTEEATKLSTFCSTSGPLFVAGSVGVGMFSDKTIGLILLISHLSSSVLCGVIFRFLPSESKSHGLLTAAKSQNVLYDSVYSAVISVAVVGGFIAVFYTFSQILSDINAFYFIEKPLAAVIGENNAKGVTTALIECTFACKTFSADPTRLSVALSCGAISFGGLSVWCQSAAYLKSANVKFYIFAAAKLVHTLLSFALCYAIAAIVLP